jgi:hypothetical protein
MKTDTLLISGIGKRNALLRLLKLECDAANIRLWGADAKALPPARLETTNFAVLPLAQDIEFTAAYTSLLKKTQAKSAFTLVDPEIPLIGDVENELGSANFCTLHPVAGSARLCEDKFEFAHKARQGGIDVFDTSLAPLKSFPQICKDRQGSAASGFKILQTQNDLNELPKHGLIYQSYCGGDHYCVDAYFSHRKGELIDLCVKRVLDKHRGESFLLEAMPHGRFVDILRAVSSVIPLRGIVNFDFLEDNGTMRMLEINCRIGGNYPASHAFGCNFIKLGLHDIFGEADITPRFSKYKQGLIVAKYFDFSPPVAMLSPLAMNANS